MFHIRYTPYDISGYTFSFLADYDSYIVGREHLDSNLQPLLHYHILIGTHYGEKSVRDAVKLHLKIPPGGRGKNNAYYALISDWEDPSYICKYNDVVSSKGYSEKEILDYVIEGKKKYLDKQVVSIPEEMKPKPKVVKVPYQQMVINNAYIDWMAYKRECQENEEIPAKAKLVDFVCKAMRAEGKGINAFMVKDIAYAILYDDIEYRERILGKLKLLL